MSTQTSIDTKVKLKEPSLYKVVLLNDDYTPQQFVMEVLMTIFHKSEAESYDLMMQVHNHGRGVAGIYTKEVADQKVLETTTVARHNNHPLLSTSEIA